MNANALAEIENLAGTVKVQLEGGRSGELLRLGDLKPLIENWDQFITRLQARLVAQRRKPPTTVFFRSKKLCRSSSETCCYVLSGELKARARAKSQVRSPDTPASISNSRPQPVGHCPLLIVSCVWCSNVLCLSLQRVAKGSRRCLRGKFQKEGLAC